MADKFFQTRSFVTYWLDAIDEHSLHSPFLFDFYTNVIKSKKEITGSGNFESLRTKLLQDQRNITVNDLGSGASPSSLKTLKISDIARTSLSNQKFSSLYARIINHFNARIILELGTSFGINTLYLASGKNARITTFEGATEVSDIAKLTFEFSESTNIDLISGNIDSTLPAHLLSLRKIDFVFIDANHRFEPTVRYINQLLPYLHSASIMILDDIHYSPEMEKAWHYLQQHKLVYASADLYRCGIVFFDPSLNKQHVVLQF